MHGKKNSKAPVSDSYDCPLCKIYHTPNETTLAAIRELEEGRGHRVNSVEELMEQLHADDDE